MCDELPERIDDGLKRLATVMRSDEWVAAQALGLTPTQLQILGLLDGRRAGLRVTDIAVHLGVSQPSATESANALCRKGYASKATGTDRRSSVLTPTTAGRTAWRQARRSRNATRAALAVLPATVQEDLLAALVTVIGGLQNAGAVPLQRMCATCRYFEPFRHADGAPHHCHFVDAPLRRRDVRLDCRDHEIADPGVRAATWMSLQQGSAPPPSQDQKGT